MDICRQCGHQYLKLSVQISLEGNKSESESNLPRLIKMGCINYMTV